MTAIFISKTLPTAAVRYRTSFGGAYYSQQSGRLDLESHRISALVDHSSS